MLVNSVVELTELEEVEGLLLQGYYEYAQEHKLTQTLTPSEIYLICQQIFGSSGPPKASLISGPIYALGTSFEVLKGLRSVAEERVQIHTFYRHKFVIVSLQLYDTPTGKCCVKGYEVQRAMLDAFNVLEKKEKRGDGCEITTYAELVAAHNAVAHQFDVTDNL